MDFLKMINTLYKVRIGNLSNPNKAGFSFWKWADNRRLYSYKMTVKDNSGNPINVIYADQNPEGKSYEASLVKRHIFLPHQIGWLWAEKDGLRVWLAKITPKGGQALRAGEIDINKNTIDIKNSL